jgi:hypothetical protein
MPDNPPDNLPAAAPATVPPDATEGGSGGETGPYRWITAASKPSSFASASIFLNNMADWSFFVKLTVVLEFKSL